MSASSEDGAALQQFCLLAKSAKGAGCASLIGQALEHPGIFVFGELLDMPSIKELAGTAAAPHLELLKLFAWGTWSDYKSRAAQLPALPCHVRGWRRRVGQGGASMTAGSGSGERRRTAALSCMFRDRFLSYSLCTPRLMARRGGGRAARARNSLRARAQRKSRNFSPQLQGGARSI